MSRPTLLPGLRRLRRDEHSIQLGTDPARAVVLEFTDPGLPRVLDMLDGTRTTETVIREATRLGVPEATVRTVLDLLADAGLTVSANTLLPPGLPETMRRRLTTEGAALALRGTWSAAWAGAAAVARAPTAEAPGPGSPSPGSPSPGSPSPGSPSPGSPSRESPPGRAAGESDPPGTTDPPGTADPPGTTDTAGTTDPAGQGDGPPQAGATGQAGATRQAGATGQAGGQGPRRRSAPPTPAQRLRRRAAAHVLVSGYPRLAVPIAAALAAAGVGHVDPVLVGRTRLEDVAIGGLLPADVDRPRSAAAVDAVTRIAPGTSLRPLRDGTATFVVQGGMYRPAELTALSYARRGMPHLTIDLRDGTAVIGPLVTPSGGPCLNCVDLHRRDHDPVWPALAAQLSTGPDHRAPCTVTTALAAAAYAVEDVLAYIDGEIPQTIGTTIEITCPGCERRRTWPPHPRCGCGRRRRQFSAG